MTTPEKPTKKRPSSASLDTSSSFNPFTMMMPHKKMTAIKWRLGAFSLGRRNQRHFKSCTCLGWKKMQEKQCPCTMIFNMSWIMSTQGACIGVRSWQKHQKNNKTTRVKFQPQLWLVLCLWSDLKLDPCKAPAIYILLAFQRPEVLQSFAFGSTYDPCAH